MLNPAITAQIEQDRATREEALDVKASFIVQAPAGSGKTELLIQRSLALLAQSVQYPEEILAITFTKKAAAEMKERIFAALSFAEKEPAPHLAAHALLTWRLARLVLERDKKQGWDLLKNPNRLNIMTIDAFCRTIVSRLPLFSKINANQNVLENSYFFYQMAARAFLKHLDTDSSFTDLPKRLLFLLDNDYERAETLLIHMLSCRDQWLPLLVHTQKNQMVAYFEKALLGITKQFCHKLSSLFEKYIAQEELVSLFYFSTASLQLPLNGLSTLQTTALLKEQLAFWQHFSFVLLTQSGDCRKTVNKNQGFPSSQTAKEPEKASKMKRTIIDLLAKINQDSLLIDLLGIIQCLPTVDYYHDPEKIEKIILFFECLRLAYAELKLLFQQYNQVDFAEIALNASLGLEDFEQSGEIHLLLDYQIQHILLDEFQDTSRLQFDLLENLTKEWASEPQKTLFLVGDPMQSIYRFRQAEVGLFLQVKANGLNNIPIKSLTLFQNFRSQSGLIDWFNKSFQYIFPTLDDLCTGAIAYTPAVSTQADLNAPAVFYCQGKETHTAESFSKSLVLEVQSLLPQAESIAILVRKKIQLIPIMQALSEANLPYHAVGIETLFEYSVIQDLIAMTVALMNPADKLAWFSLLRIPCIALPLEDLLVLSEQLSEDLCMLDLLKNLSAIQGLSESAQVILQRIAPYFLFAIEERGRFPVYRWVSDLWTCLGGKQCLKNKKEMEAVSFFFNFLSTWEPPLLDYENFKFALETKFNDLLPRTAKIHLMTIHKAKGLEFDYVFLPELQAIGKGDRSQLLSWYEQAFDEMDPALHQYKLLAPKKALGEDFDPMYTFIQTVEKIKAAHELSRLFYVAVTRAKKALFLYFRETFKDEKPASNSFLAQIFPRLKESAHPIQSPSVCEAKEISPFSFIKNDLLFYRALPLKIQLALVPPKLQSSTVEKNAEITYQLDWEKKRKLGVLYHRIMQWIALHFSGAPIETVLLGIEKKLPVFLSQLQLPAACFVDIKKMLLQHFNQILDDPIAVWFLLRPQQLSACEYAITLREKKYGKYITSHYFIDRTFVDEQDKRWIIDYKNAELPTTYSLEEKKTYCHEHYLAQLLCYADYFKKTESRNIGLAIYLLQEREWIDLSEI